MLTGGKLPSLLRNSDEKTAESDTSRMLGR